MLQHAQGTETRARTWQVEMTTSPAACQEDAARVLCQLHDPDGGDLVASDMPAGTEGQFQLSAQHQHKTSTMQPRKGRLQGWRGKKQAQMMARATRVRG